MKNLTEGWQYQILWRNRKFLLIWTCIIRTFIHRIWAWYFNIRMKELRITWAKLYKRAPRKCWWPSTSFKKLHCNAIFLLQKKITFQNWFWSMECATFLFSFFISYHLKLQSIDEFSLHIFLLQSNVWPILTDFIYFSSQNSAPHILESFSSTFSFRTVKLLKKSKTNPKKQECEQKFGHKRSWSQFCTVPEFQKELQSHLILLTRIPFRSHSFKILGSDGFCKYSGNQFCTECTSK